MGEGVASAIENAGLQDKMWMTGAGGSKAVMEKIKEGAVARDLPLQPRRSDSHAPAGFDATAVSHHARSGVRMSTRLYTNSGGRQWPGTLSHKSRASGSNAAPGLYGAISSRRRSGRREHVESP